MTMISEVKRLSILGTCFLGLLSGCATQPVRTDGAKEAQTPSAPVAAAIMGSSSAESASEKTPRSQKTSNRKPASHAWSTYHWARQINPATLKVGDCMTTADWKTHLANSSNDWNSPTTFGGTTTPLLTAISPCASTKRCSMVSGTTQVCNGSYGKNGWLGLASIKISGGHISQGTAKMNDTYFTLAKYNNPNEKRHVVCQELAHTFGLGHQSEDGSSQNSCMDYFSNTGTNATSTASTQPNLHDFDQLNLIYAALDNTTTLASSAASATSSDDAEDPRAWGMLRSQSKDGRGSNYERSNADGSVTITHVFWTEETAAKCPGCDHRDGH